MGEMSGGFPEDCNNYETDAGKELAKNRGGMEGGELPTDIQFKSYRNSDETMPKLENQKD